MVFSLPSLTPRPPVWQKTIKNTGFFFRHPSLRYQYLQYFMLPKHLRFEPEVGAPIIFIKTISRLWCISHHQDGVERVKEHGGGDGVGLAEADAVAAAEKVAINHKERHSHL